MATFHDIFMINFNMKNKLQQQHKNVEVTMCIKCQIQLFHIKMT